LNVGELFVDITAKDNKLVQSLSKAEQKTAKSAAAMSAKLAGIGKGMTIAGGVITAAFGAIVTKTTQLGDRLDKMSKRTNVSVEQLSALGYAAKISGADLDTVEKSLRYLARGMDDVSQGIGEAKDAFEFLDIAVTDTEGNLRPTMDVLKEAATKLAAMTDETKQVALATDIFGARYGTQLLPMLKEGGDGIEALMEKAKELGIVMSTEAAAKAAEFNDRITDLKESVGGMGRSIGEILIPPLIKFSEKAIEIIKKIKAWADAHKPLVEMIVKVGATLGVLAAVGGPILLAVSAFMKMKVAITAISVAMKALAASTGPIGLIILAVGALAVAWTTNFGGIRDFTIAVVGKVTEALGWLWDKVKWVLEKLGLYKETAKEVTKANDELATATKKVGEKSEIAATGVDTLATSMDELETKTDEAKTTMDKFGNFLESFDEWTARLAEEEKQRQEEDTKKLEEEKEKQKTILEKFAEVKESIADRTYELTHTAMEKSIRDLNKQKKAYLAQGQSQKEVDKWYQAEIDKLNELHPIKDKAIKDDKDLEDGNIKLADSYEDLGEELEETTKKYSAFADKIADRRPIEEAGAGFTALSNFSKEAVAAAITQIKMKFFPVLQDLYASLETAGYAFSSLIQGQIDEINRMINEQIAQVMYGMDTYNEELNKLGGTTENLANQTSNAGGSIVNTWGKITDAANEATAALSNAINIGSGSGSGGSHGGFAGSGTMPNFNGGSAQPPPLFNVPRFAVGTPYVPKTGLALRKPEYY